MSVIVNDSIKSNSPKSLDDKYLNLGSVSYTDLTQVNSTLIPAYRSVGLTVLVGNKEYWYRDGIANTDLVPKGISVADVPLYIDAITHHLLIVQANSTQDGYLSLTDWTTFNNKLTTVAVTGSITGTGVSGVPLQLVNDLPIPGVSKYYGTDSLGAKGYFTLPSSSTAIWGTITGTLSSQSDLQSALNSKEPTIGAGTTAQYFRGDKSWQTLNTTAVPEGTNLYYTNARARLALSAGTGITYNNTTGVIATTAITSLHGTYYTAGTVGVPVTFGSTKLGEIMNITLSLGDPADTTKRTLTAKFLYILSSGSPTGIPTGTATAGSSGTTLLGNINCAEHQANTITISVPSVMINPGTYYRDALGGTITGNQVTRMALSARIDINGDVYLDHFNAAPAVAITAAEFAQDSSGNTILLIPIHVTWMIDNVS